MAQITADEGRAVSKRFDKPERKQKKTRAALTIYLFLYNFCSAVAWSYPLVMTILHLLGKDSSSLVGKQGHPVLIQKLLAMIPTTNVNYPPLKYAHFFPRWALPYIQRATTTYSVIGTATNWIQSFAVLEVVHSALGWVRSPVFTSAAQVASRLAMVWDTAPRYTIAQQNPIYTSMVLAWSMTETLRYAFYAFSVLGFEPYPLLWLRYTAFFVLYPIGAPSEAFVNFSTLPVSLYPFDLHLDQWVPIDFYHAFLFLLWWPALWYLYTYMMGQRRKVLGKRPVSSSKMAKKDQ
ncbi:hypothetical protein FRB96_002625 [Tulasnella sp. 330]|nr:hypothetical protein FRB96_002625 [Tulasnella sp. 330]KAG8884817.1 hypothetical protein FRB98_002143 [Tulasnella sp. 332]